MIFRIYRGSYPWEQLDEVFNWVTGHQGAFYQSSDDKLFWTVELHDPLLCTELCLRWGDMIASAELTA